MKSRVDTRSLQELQYAFDRAHGLDKIGASPSSTRAHLDVDVSVAQFVVLGLCGEAGELANALKKAVRAHHLGDDPSSALETVRGELADVYAYLLKLSAVMNVDLEQTYLETLTLNCIRFKLASTQRRPRLIGVAGSESRWVSDVVDEIRGTMRNRWRLVEIGLKAPPPIGRQSQLEVWLKSANRKIRSQLVASRDATHILLTNDPAYHVHAAIDMCASQHKKQAEYAQSLLHSLLEIEEGFWNSMSARVLVIGDRDTNSATARKLAAHGAHVIRDRAQGSTKYDLATLFSTL